MVRTRAQARAERNRHEEEVKSNKGHEKGNGPLRLRRSEGRKRPQENPELLDSRAPKHSRSSVCTTPPRQDPSSFIDDDTGPDEYGYDEDEEEADPIEYWTLKARWPAQYSAPGAMANQDLPPTIRTGDVTGTETRNRTPSDEDPSRRVKCAPYRHPRYEASLAAKGSFMIKPDVGITDGSKALCRDLLEKQQPLPQDSLFRDDIFDMTCQRVATGNEARILRDITPLIAPSAETLAIYGASELACLVEGVNERWTNSIPLTKTQPQPDFSVGFNDQAFTEEQLRKLLLISGDCASGERSYYTATYKMYLPFFTYEVKSGDGHMNVADRQNAHSMSVAAQGVVELFRLVNRENELHCQILAFSISHNERYVRIYGEYPVFKGKEVKYYRHQIEDFSLVRRNGEERWTAYTFTRNVYALWMPKHLDRIRSAIDQLPSASNFDVSSLSGTSPDQAAPKSRPKRADHDLASESTERQLSSAAAVTPRTSPTKGKKRPRRRRK